MVVLDVKNSINFRMNKLLAKASTLESLIPNGLFFAKGNFARQDISIMPLSRFQYHRGEQRKYRIGRLTRAWINLEITGRIHGISQSPVPWIIR